MARHRLLARAAYQTHFHLMRMFSRPSSEGVSLLLVTWNRARFLAETLSALEVTLPDAHELLVWDNASQDDTPAVLEKFRSSRLKLRVFHSPRNIGTSGYAQLALRARGKWLIELDDDVLALPHNWTESMITTFHVFPELGYLCLDVVQDEFTNGAKPPPDRYRAETRQGITVEFGPTGGWATMVPREFYFSAGGFPFRPHKPFFSEDGYFNRSVAQHHRRSGLLKGVCAYHATGPAWNAAFGYQKLHEQKLACPGAATAAGSASVPAAQTLPDLSVLEPYRSGEDRR